MMNILVYVRPATTDFYLKLVKTAYPHANIVTVSDFKHNGDIWFGDYIYQLAYKEQYFSDEIMRDIRMRCRFLRLFQSDMADGLVNNLAYGLYKYFSSHDIDIVMGGLIDNYTQDVLERIAVERKIPYISFVRHFFSGYCRISARGELRKMPRVVTNEEVSLSLKQIMQESFKPDFKLNRPKSTKEMYYFYFRELLKKNLYFPLKRNIERDPHNYHYNTTLPRNWSFSSVIFKDDKKYFRTLENLPSHIDENAVYIPLHFSPEATVDYWADNPRFALQEETILELATQTPAHIQLLIKEHPAMYLRRRIDFYERLKDYNNVTLIHPYESSNRLLNIVQNVLVFTGSVGVEALLRGKRVLTVTKNYYSDLHPNIFKISQINDEAIRLKLQTYSQEQFIHDILQGLFKADFYNDKTIDKSDIESMSRNFKDYMNAFMQEKIVV
ncbi:MAG: hypothetical protein KO464_06930 [Candidatus Methanofastidiosum sp.]|nr:hypothetical protein [Methanofastidiosum sp.]